MTLRWAHPLHSIHGMPTQAELEAEGWRVLIVRRDGKDIAAQDPRYAAVLMVREETE